MLITHWVQFWLSPNPNWGKERAGQIEVRSRDGNTNRPEEKCSQAEKSQFFPKLFPLDRTTGTWVACPSARVPHHLQFEELPLVILVLFLVSIY